MAIKVGDPLPPLQDVRITDNGPGRGCRLFIGGREIHDVMSYAVERDLKGGLPVVTFKILAGSLNGEPQADPPSVAGGG